VCKKPCPNCVEIGEKNKVFNFLMGLNPEYESVRSVVFAQLSLPPIGEDTMLSNMRKQEEG
jgi:hypothetical protein